MIPGNFDEATDGGLPRLPCSHSSGVTRDLLVVIEQMLGMIPMEEMEIRRSLNLQRETNLYCAPEMQDWRAVSATLQAHCEGRSDSWIEEILSVWRNDANACLSHGDGSATTPPEKIMITTPQLKQHDESPLGSDSCSASFVPTLPTEFGYYWVTKKPDEKPVMLHLSPSKKFKNDERSVEAWECPGIGRRRLDILNMPRWVWVSILPPNAKCAGTDTSAPTA